MKLLSYFVLVCALAGIGHAEMPTCYKSVNRVVWLVQNVDLAKQAWIPLGLTDIHQMNALKTFLAACINLVAVIEFTVKGKVAWPYALLMAVAAIAGGYLGAHYARRLRPSVVRWFVIAIGFALSAYFFFGPGIVGNEPPPPSAP